MNSQWYFRSNFDLYEDVGGKYLYNITRGWKESTIPSNLPTLFPELFILKWKE